MRRCALGVGIVNKFVSKEQITAEPGKIHSSHNSIFPVTRKEFLNTRAVKSTARKAAVHQIDDLLRGKALLLRPKGQSFFLC